MRCARRHLRLASLALVGIAGCVHHPHSEARPERPEDYTVPPTGLYTKPPDIPKEYMNQFPGRRNTNPDNVPAPTGGPMQRMGGAGPARGPY